MLGGSPVALEARLVAARELRALGFEAASEATLRGYSTAVIDDMLQLRDCSSEITESAQRIISILDAAESGKLDNL